MDAQDNHSRSDSPFLNDTSANRPEVIHADVGARRRLGLGTLVPALIVFLFCISLPAIMLWYLLSRPAISPATEDLHLFEGAIIAVEGSQRSTSVSNAGSIQVSTLYGLAFATVLSHVVSVTVPLLMGLLAYRVAARWLNSRSKSDDEKQSKPSTLTPLQYGIMLKIYGSSNVFSLIQSGRYLYRQKWVGMFKSPVAPSFAALAFVLFLSHAISFVDLWLHTVSGTVVYSSVTPVDDLASMPYYGTTINKTICPYPGYAQFSNSPLDPPVGFTPGAIPAGQNCASYENSWEQQLPLGPGWGDIHHASVLSASVSASNNISDFRTTVIVESDNMAVLVPPSINADGLYNFTASTYGISMSCRLPNCRLYDTGPPKGVDGGPFGCTDFNPVYNTSLTNLTSFFYDPTTMAQQRYWSNGTGNNPFGFFIELPFDNIPHGLQTSGTDARNFTNGEPGWYFGASNPATEPGLVVYLTQCTVTSYNVLLSNFNNTYTILNSSHTDFNTTSALSSGFISWMASTYLLPQIQSVLGSEVQATSFSSELQTQLMLRSLALNAGILEATPINSSVTSTPLVASRYPIAPVATFIALLFIYGIVALVVIVWTCFSAADSVIVYSEKGKKNTVNMLHMAQVRLTDPLAAVAEWFPESAGANERDDSQSEGSGAEGGKESEDWRRTLETDPLDMFDPDGEASVVPQIQTASSGNIRFSL